MNVHTPQGYTVFDTAAGIHVLKRFDVSVAQRGLWPVVTSAFPKISTPSASLSDLMRTSGVLPKRTI